METGGLLPSHVLSAILTLAKRKKGEQRFAFRAYDHDLQSLFHKIVEETHYQVMEEFVFSSSGPVPYSPTLTDSVSKLQLSGLLGRENPDYEILFLTPAADDFYDKVVEKELSPRQIEQLQKVAESFLTGVGTP